MVHVTTAIILCGGQALRMKINGIKTPKQLLRFDESGRTILGALVQQLVGWGFNEIVIAVASDQEGRDLRRKIQRSVKGPISFVVGKAKLGMLDRIRGVLDRRKGKAWQRFMVCYGDTFVDSLRGLPDNWLSSKNRGLSVLGLKGEYQFGMWELNHYGPEIWSQREIRSLYINIGYHIMDRELLSSSMKSRNPFLRAFYLNFLNAHVKSEQFHIVEGLLYAANNVIDLMNPREA